MGAVKDFAAIATEYARDVVEGRQIACRWLRLACQRHLNDLAKADAGWKYQFNPELVDLKGKAYRPAQRICQFAELMPHIKGDWAARAERIKLERWQIFFLACAFGWINVETGKRRFRVVDLIVPRKNAKSTVAAVIGLYMLGPDGEFGAEVYSGATSKDQALEVFRPARLMAVQTPQYRSVYGVVPNISNLAVIDTNSKFEPVIGKPGDGASPSCAIVDEYHEHQTPELYETMETGMGARSQPLLLMITTAGSNIGGPCYQHQVALQQILEGTVENDQRFGIIFTIDAEDDWTSEEALRKANPNYDVSVSGEFLKAMLRDALADPRKQSTFKTKHLNVWVASASPWVNIENLQRCGDAPPIEEFAGESCWAGLDLASQQDIASRVLEFRREVDGKTHYYAYSKNYIPAAAVEKPENAHYRGWAAQGHLIVTDGNMIDLERIQEELLEDTEPLGLEEVAKDPWGGQQLGSNLEQAGLVVVDVPQRVAYLSEPMKNIAALIDAGRFHHDGNPAFVWMMSNVEVLPDRNDNIFPRKPSAERKIDNAIALILAHGRAVLGETNDADNVGIFVL
jgi:phage terminase large subunit-like protein